ncbi:type II toxin-antitoxin system VapB family antitoxin [Candidatus Aerophobetes bacterium]|nr:type II toxin-antitoxin system VapB family antitoxin [Candidatus Aerophobetes bacterium]
MGKTTVVINDKLIEEAMKVVGVRTKKEAIERGLRELIKSKMRQTLREELGTYELSLDLKELERMRGE